MSLVASSQAKASRAPTSAETVRLLVGVPCTQTGITESFLHSLLALQRHCMSLGWELQVQTRTDGLVTRTRNIFGSLMVHSEAHTHLLMVDADIGFEPQVVERLVRSGLDVVGACVPLREVRWSLVGAALKDAPGLQAEELQAISHRYAVSLMIDGPSQARREGFQQASFIGSGLMLVRRRVFAQLAVSAQVTAYESGTPCADGKSGGWTFFDPLIDPVGKTYLSEDYAFCRRWRELGGEVWADLRSRTTHSGLVTIHGDMALTLKTQARQVVGL